ncbi:hypothetical protein JVU11DRAFT_8250 [Chiua virens]|nr:hypothetical protein JVU11DRAFT_8250 [Chiua virens]
MIPPLPRHSSSTVSATSVVGIGKVPKGKVPIKSSRCPRATVQRNLRDECQLPRNLAEFMTPVVRQVYSHTISQRLILIPTYDQAVRRPFVNFVDLVDTKRTGVRVELFTTAHKLGEYTRSTGKCFPRKHPNAGRVLRSLLQHPRDAAFRQAQGCKGAPLKEGSHPSVGYPPGMELHF